MVSISTIFISDIEKAFRGHLPQNCINILAMLVEQQLTMEKALNDQQNMLKTMMKALALSAQADALMVKELKRFDGKYDDPHKDLIRNEEIKE